MKCAVKGCKKEYDLKYYGKPICDHHWGMHCGDGTFDIKKKLGLKSN